MSKQLNPAQRQSDYRAETEVLAAQNVKATAVRLFVNRAELVCAHGYGLYFCPSCGESASRYSDGVS